MQKRTLILTLVILAGAAACGRGPELETRTFRLNHLSAQQAAKIVDPYVTSLEQGRISVVSGGGVQAITVRQSPRTLERIAQVLAEYDRDAPPVQLRFRVVEADGFPTDSALAGPVLVALQRAFRFRGYRQLAEGVTAVSAHGEFEQRLSGGNHRFRLVGDVGQFITGDSAHAGGSIQLRIGLQMESVSGDLISTQVTIPLGKTVVLGTARPGSDTGAYILTVEPTARTD